MLNNQILHTHEIVSLLTPSLPEMSETVYRIKFNGKFVCIKNKNEWARISNAKSAFKMHIRRYNYVFTRNLPPPSAITTGSFYRLLKDDIDNIFNQLIADNVLEFVECSRIHRNI